MKWRNRIKGVGLNPLSYWHHNDHLGVVCVIMGIPLLLTDKELFELTCALYPGLTVEYIDWEELTPDYLADNYDVFFRCDMWDRKSFHEKFAELEKKYGKKIRSVHCPHGFSDKSFWLKKVAEEDITLIYGQNMLDMLEREKVRRRLNDYLITGNYRFTYYKKHQEHFDSFVKNEITVRFPTGNKTLLYAPTWNDEESSSSFFAAADALMKHLPNELNLIIKLHPQIEQNDLIGLQRIIGKYESKPNILFLEHFPLVYPLLACSDLYIGDASSIGYDYLAFDRPMLFLNQRQLSENDPRAYLFRCGETLLPQDYSKVHQTIENLLKNPAKHSRVRKEVYDYTFGPEKPFKTLFDEMWNLLYTKND